MADRASDIRKFASIVNEASLADLAKGMGNAALGAMGSSTAQGKTDALDLAMTMQGKYKKWLGRTGQSASEETLMNFLVGQLGFTAANARKLFQKSNIQDPTKTTESVELLELNKNQMDSLFKNAAQFAYQYGLVPGEEGQRHSYGHGSRSRRSATGTTRDEREAERLAKRADKTAAKQAARDEKAADRTDSDIIQQVNRTTMMAALKQSGVELGEVADLEDVIAQGKDFLQLLDDPKLNREDTVDQLARIGYSYLKASL